MDIMISPSTLRGTVQAPPSKSAAHRAMICAALADGPTVIQMGGPSEDIRATGNCLTALGAEIRPLPDGVQISPIKTAPRRAVLDCGESGSTLRFLLPVAAVLSEEAAFTGRGRLPHRPLSALVAAMEAQGCTFSGHLLPFTVYGPLLPGCFTLPGNISSQYFSGLLFALPMLGEDSEIHISSPLESEGYVRMTLQSLQTFGVPVSSIPNGYFVAGGSQYHSPGNISIEGDWSNAAFFLTAAMFGHAVAVTGLSEASLQGDRAIAPLLARLSDGQSDRVIDVSGIPDLVPILAVAACGVPGTTVLTNAARLRLKESDRLRTTSAMLTSLGAQVKEAEDSLTIFGGVPLHGGETDSYGDHRIAMAAAIASLLCRGSVTIRHAEAVNKSYPDFYQILKRLGGDLHVL